MTKSKTNALDTLRALIAERQQYDQWMATLESKRDGTPEHVFNRVHSDYRSRLDRVVGEIRSHSEELQLSITALSTRLGEVAKDEEAKRDSMQEVELRAAVGEYDTAHWESLRAESNRELERIAADRGTLEGQLAELESIRKLSEVAAPPVDEAAAAQRATGQPAPPFSSTAAPAPSPEPRRSEPSASRPGDDFATRRAPPSDVGWPTRDVPDEPAVVAPASSAGVMGAAEGAPHDTRSTAQTPAQPPRVSEGAPARVGAIGTQPLPLRGSEDATVAAPRPSAIPVAPPPAPAPPARKKRDTPTARESQRPAGFSRPVPTPAEGRPEVNKTLKCPECGTANYPTEWYCERCGGELATM